MILPNQIFAGFTRRFVARLIDWAILLIIALIIGFFGSVILAALRPDNFQAYFEYTLSQGGNQLSLDNLTTREPGNLFQCDQAEDPETCQQAEVFSMYQTALIMGVFVGLQILYFGILTSSKFQATFGKHWLKLKVVGAGFGKPSFWQAITREIFFVFLFLASALTLFFPQVQFVVGVLEVILLASSLKIILSPERTAFHDNLAYTKVIINE